MATLLTKCGIEGSVQDLQYTKMVYVDRDLSDRDELYIRTSERSLFKKCRRLWAWTSPLKAYREIKDKPNYFWFGTGMHYALEDYHGYNKYGHPAAAFLAYCQATHEAKLAPFDHKELAVVGANMMVYYKDHWLDKGQRNPIQTLIVDGVPQCEVRFKIELPIKGPNGQRVVYRGMIDRMGVDDEGQIWVIEYKSAKAFRLQHFDTDDQVTAYCWAAQSIYGVPIAGVIYQQHRKVFPSKPRMLSTGKLSTSKTMLTTHAIYASALIEAYGSFEVAPLECRKYLQTLVSADDDEDGDKFIRRDKIYRNQYQIASQGEKILLEVEEILRPDLALYPNPGKDCSWMCPLETVCIAMDDGSEWETLLLSMTRKREEESDEWRNLLPQEAPVIPQGILNLEPLKPDQQEQMEKLARTQESNQEDFLNLLDLEW